SMRAGPVVSRAIAPVVTKIPAPMMAPMPMLVSCTGPSTRRSRPAWASWSSRASGFRAKSWLIRTSAPVIGGGPAPSLVFCGEWSSGRAERRAARIPRRAEAYHAFVDAAVSGARSRTRLWVSYGAAWLPFAIYWGAVVLLGRGSPSFAVVAALVMMAGAALLRTGIWWLSRRYPSARRGAPGRVAPPPGCAGLFA